MYAYLYVDGAERNQETAHDHDPGKPRSLFTPSNHPAGDMLGRCADGVGGRAFRGVFRQFLIMILHMFVDPLPEGPPDGI